MNDEMFNRLTSMLNQSSNFKNSKNVDVSMDSSYSSNTSNQSSFDNNTSYNNSNNGFDFSNLDMETIMKIKNIMNQFNSNRSNPRANLLQALKPYLKDEKKEKLDQYMQFINISSVLEILNNSGGVNNG